VVNLGSGQLVKDASGNVGIGTSSPQAKLHITGTGFADANVLLGARTVSGTELSTALWFESPDGMYAMRNNAGNLTFSSGGTLGIAVGTETLRITDAGNVGIGTTAPAVRLTGTVLSLNGATQSSIELLNGDASSGELFSNVNGTVLAEFRNLPLQFRSDNTERMRITSAGNVGIGTTSNQSTWTADKAGLLSVESAATYTNLVAMTYNTASAAGGSVLTLGRSRSATLGTRAVTSSGDFLGIVTFEGVNTGSSMVSAGYILGSQDGAAGASFIPGALRFFTATNAAAPTERMRITSAGNVGIGTTNPGANLAIDGTNPNVQLGGAYRVYADLLGSITGTTGTVVFSFDGVFTVTRQTAIIRISLQHLVGTNTLANQPGVECTFIALAKSDGTCQISAVTPIIQNAYDVSTDLAFASTGSTTFTMTFTNPISTAAAGAAYKVEIVSGGAGQGGFILTGVTTS
jgi:hypothetical protein